MADRRSNAALAALAAVLVAAPALEAQEQAEPPPIAQYRSSVMEALQSHTGALRALLGGGVTHPDHVLPHAESVAALAMMLDGIFPEGSGGAGTRALPAVWDDAAAFGAALTRFQTAAAALVDAARSGDMAAASDASREVGMSCRNCHGDFRARAGG